MPGRVETGGIVRAVSLGASTASTRAVLFRVGSSPAAVSLVIAALLSPQGLSGAQVAAVTANADKLTAIGGFVPDDCWSRRRMRSPTNTAQRAVEVETGDEAVNGVFVIFSERRDGAAALPAVRYRAAIFRTACGERSTATATVGALSPRCRANSAKPRTTTRTGCTPRCRSCSSARVSGAVSRNDREGLGIPQCTALAATTTTS